MSDIQNRKPADAATSLPGRLGETVELLSWAEDRAARIQLLIDLGAHFNEVAVSPDVATRPFDEAHRVPGCESEAFVFAVPRPDSTLDFHFAVENPQGVSARALALILGRGLNGVPPSEVVRVDPELVYTLFGRELSMGKSMGLMGMVAMVRELARDAVKQGDAAIDDTDDAEQAGRGRPAAGVKGVEA